MHLYCTTRHVCYHRVNLSAGDRETYRRHISRDSHGVYRGIPRAVVCRTCLRVIQCSNHISVLTPRWSHSSSSDMAKRNVRTSTTPSGPGANPAAERKQRSRPTGLHGVPLHTADLTVQGFATHPQTPALAPKRKLNTSTTKWTVREFGSRPKMTRT